MSRKSLLGVVVVMALGTFIVLGATDLYSKNQEKITICHFPPGESEEGQTIVISQDSLETHLAHGDIVGSCEGIPVSDLQPSDPIPITPPKESSGPR